MGDKKIFIQIASYRDPQLITTLRDCISNAKYPENLVFSIAWQHSVEDEWDSLYEYKNDKRFRVLDINYKDAKVHVGQEINYNKIITKKNTHYS